MVWANNGSMNISAFVFRDINRNGRYDLGDISFSAIATQMVKPDNIIISKRSNIAGFANFNASRSNIDADINGAGNYRLQIFPPPGWKTTTNNAEQTISIRALPGAPADIVASP